MLYEFISAHREELLARIAAALSPTERPGTATRDGRVASTLILAHLVEAMGVTVPSVEQTRAIAAGGALQGKEMFAAGFTAAQVVRSYAEVSQAVTELADERGQPSSNAELRSLHECLNAAATEAVSEYTRQWAVSFVAGEAQRSGILAHELRNRLSAATLAFSMLRTGRVAVNGSVGEVVSRNLRRLTELVNRSLIEVRVDSGNEHRRRVAVGELVEEAEVDGLIEADARHMSLSLTKGDQGAYVDADPHVLSGAIANLVSNAFKFTHSGGHVSLRTSATDERVVIEVEDQCGGLPPGRAEELFEAFQQRGTDRSGLGLGLYISRKAVEACGGSLHVRDLPRKGCIFAIDLPKVATR